jgi:hypothetical protein
LIDERPKVVEEQSRVSDWEGDTIESASIATVVDRKPKLLLANIMPDKRADTLNWAAVHAFRGIPPEARHILTLDNGKEFAAHGALSQALSLDIFLSIPIIPGSGALTSIPTGSSDSTFRKKYRLTPRHKDGLTRSLIQSTIDLARF